MNHRCKLCDSVGKITGVSNSTDKTKFIASQWYKDGSGYNHTLLICCTCGAFHDCKFSILKMSLENKSVRQGVSCTATQRSVS